MNTLEVIKKPLNLREYIKRSALESDYDTLVTDSTMVFENGKLKVIYENLDEIGFDANPMIRALQSIRYETGLRTTGLKTTSRIFGYRPRATVRKNYCSITSMATEHPAEHKVICDYAARVSEVYLKRFPELHKKHQEAVNAVKPEWVIPGSVFTSGIVNKNNPLKFHFDTGNFNDVFSAMLVFKSGIKGGHLALPEYGLGFELKNNSLFMFDGQGILHGVTPIKKASPLAFRYSVVYYSLKQMWKCLTVTEELANVRKDKTTREQRRALMTREEKMEFYRKQGYEVWEEDGKIRVKKNRF